MNNPFLQQVGLVAALILIIGYFLTRKKKPLHSLNEMSQRFMALKGRIEACVQYDELGHLEELVDDFYNQYNGRLPVQFVRAYSNELYNILSAKGIELCSSPQL